MARVLFTVFLSLVAISALADGRLGSLHVSSGEKRVALLELYTSEGCSSCPPADRWLSKLKDDSGLWTEFAPIALHVDYWDYIGWKDRFASTEYSERQRRHVNESAARAVYTPGFFQDGEEWLGWRRGQRPGATPDVVGDLSVQLDGGALAVTFHPEKIGLENPELIVAILGMQLETRVRAGENKGRTLYHDFVVLDLARHRMEKRGNGYRLVSVLPTKVFDARELALVAWVSAPDTQVPIQTVGGYITRKSP